MINLLDKRPQQVAGAEPAAQLASGRTVSARSARPGLGVGSAWPILLAALGLMSLPSPGAVFEVGEGKPYPAVGQVPWESLAAGDTVLIHWRAAPYAEKWVVCRQGTADAPITIRGVPGPTGQLPVIDGNGATTRPQLNYWNQERGVVKVGGANVPPDTTPAHIVIENLEIRGARPPNAFVNAAGSAVSYPKNAAAIYVEKGDFITLRNCVLQDCGNGLFVAHAARDVLIEANYIHDNGNVGSIYEHNSYTAAERITFQFNRYGPLRPDCLGNNLKDRSAGLVVRYNWIEGGNRQLDLVDAEDSVALQNSPLYRTTHVYGNVLIEPDNAGNSQIVHYGGDSGATDAYRKGTLYFYHNTVVSTRAGNTTLFRLSTEDEFCDCRNNVFYVSAAGSRLALLNAEGRLLLTHNWLKPGFVPSHSDLTGVITNDHSNLTGEAPGFLDVARQDFRLTTNSACIDAGVALPPSIAASHSPAWHYLKHQQARRRNPYQAPDLGAFEFSAFAAWQRRAFGTDAEDAAVSSEDADPDSDGVPNLMEYAFLMDPLVRSRTGIPQGTLVTDDDALHFAIQFWRRPAPSELTYRVQTSGDLRTWLAGSSYSDAASVPASAVTSEVSSAGPVVVRLSAPLGELSHHFMRVGVEAAWR